MSRDFYDDEFDKYEKKIRALRALLNYERKWRKILEECLINAIDHDEEESLD